MAVKLIYKHQQKTYELIKKELKRSGKAAYEFPTGCGKSFPALKYIEDNPDKNVLIVSPSRAINRQYKKYIETYVENGKERLKRKNIAIVSYQKIGWINKIVNGLKADAIIVDEVHRMGAEKWGPDMDEFIEKQKGAEIIAMTATPKRGDGKNVIKERFADNVVYEMSLTDALSGDKEGEVILKNPRYIKVLSALMPKIQGYQERISEIENEELKNELLTKYEKLKTILSNSPGLEDVIAEGMKVKNGKYIVFCKDREDLKEKMQNAKSIFGKVNENIEIDYVLNKRGKSDDFGKSDISNELTLEKFENAERNDSLQLLFCVDKLNEGIHIEGIDGEVLFDFTKSPVLYKQRIGRVTSVEKETVIIDAVNNWIAQLDTYKEIAEAVERGRKKEKENGNDEIDENDDKYLEDNLFRLLPEETDLLKILKEIKEGLLYKNKRDVYGEFIKFLEKNNGVLPRNLRETKKERSDLSEEEYYEVNLRERWTASEERKILLKYIGYEIGAVPEEYKEKITKLREFGLGIDWFDDFIEFLEKSNGKLPRGSGNLKDENKKVKLRENMTEEEKIEVNLRDRWYNSEERKVLEKYIGYPIEKVPEKYREKIEKLRGFGLGLEKEKDFFEKIIDFLQENNGNLPRWNIKKENGKGNKTRNEMSKEEKLEVRLRQKWGRCKERKILEEYYGRPIEEVPEKYREKIARLRKFGIGLEIKKEFFEELVEFLEKNDGSLPSQYIKTDEGTKRKNRTERTEEEKKQINLYEKWSKSEEKKILEKYAGCPIEKIPEKYRENIIKLREYGLGLEVKKEVCDEICNWLMEHNGKLPRKAIYKENNERKIRIEMTDEEKYEVNLRSRWDRSKEKKVLNKYANKPIEEVPEEYREKIAKLRSLGQKGKRKDDEIKEKMKDSVGKNVEFNEEIREELKAEKDKSETKNEGEKDDR